MADLADINVSIEVDDTSVLKGIDRVAKLEKGYGKLDRAFNKGKITAQQYSKGIQQVDAAIKRATTSTKALQQAQMAATKSSNRMGVVTQQAGYQVSDFIVQVQSGTNAFVAFGQQASQLVGVLPLVAAPLGLSATAAIGLSAGLGIAIPLVTAIGAAFTRMNKDAKEAKTQIELLTEAHDDLESALEGVTEPLDDLIRKFGQYADVIKQARIEKLEDQFSKAQQAIKSATTDITDFVDQFEKLGALGTKQIGIDLGVSMGGPRGQVYSQEQILQLEKAKDLFNQIAEAEGPENQLEVLGDIRDLFTDLGLDVSNFPELDVSNLSDFVQQAKLLENQLRMAKAEINGMNVDTEFLVDRLEAGTIAIEDLLPPMGKARDIQKDHNDHVVTYLKHLDDIQASFNKQYNSMLAQGALLKRELDLRGDYKDETYIQERLEQKKLDLYIEQNNLTTAQGDQLHAALSNLLEQKKALEDLNDQEKARLNLLSVQQKMRGVGVASGRGGDPRDPRLQGTHYQKEFGYKTVDELIAEHNARNKGVKETIDLTRELTDVQKQQVAIADSVSGAFGDFFMDLVDGTTSAKDAFRSMATDIIQQLYRILVVEQLVQSIKGAVTSAFAPASAAGTEGTVAPPKRPTKIFGKYEGGGYTGSGPRSGGLDGKGGFMAMLHPRETVVDHTKGQGAGGDINIVQNFSFSANGDDSVRKIIAQAAPQIAKMTQQQIVDSRRRGGAMKAAFGG